MLVSLWLSRYWNAVYLLTLVALGYLGCIVFVFQPSVLVRAVNVLQLILTNKTKPNKTCSDTENIDSTLSM